MQARSKIGLPGAAFNPDFLHLIRTKKIADANNKKLNSGVSQ